MSAVLHEADEAVERGLFERRARVLDARAGVPSLDAVLRASRKESRETSPSAWGRGLTALAVAAACALAVVKTRPHETPHPRIQREPERTTQGAAAPTDVACEAPEESACSLESARSSPVTVVDDERACVAPPATFASSSSLSCDDDEANLCQAY